jgi:hypothetical protein
VDVDLPSTPLRSWAPERVSEVFDREKTAGIMAGIDSRTILVESFAE